MKVLFVTSSLSYGGAEKMLCFVANGLCHRKHSICIVNMLEEEKTVQKLAPEITVHRIASSGIRYVEKIEMIRAMKKKVISENPDIIVAFKSTQAWLTCLAAKKTHIPVVFSERCDPYMENLKRWRTFPYWKLINHCAGAVFQTEGAREYFGEELQKRSAVIPNPVFSMDGNINDNDLEEKAIVSIGRFENRQKRYDVMLDAFGAFVRTHPEYKLKLYGTGEDEQQIRQWVQEKNIQDSVQFMGYAGTPTAQLKNGNIFLITSDYEGISNAMLEAMAAGCPVVSTDSSPGGARMVIQNGENGLLVPAGDAKKIAEALSMYADNDQLRYRCATQAKQVTERYNPTAILDQWEKYLLKTAGIKS